MLEEGRLTTKCNHSWILQTTQRNYIELLKHFIRHRTSNMSVMKTMGSAIPKTLEAWKTLKDQKTWVALDQFWLQDLWIFLGGLNSFRLKTSPIKVYLHYMGKFIFTKCKAINYKGNLKVTKKVMRGRQVGHHMSPQTREWAKVSHHNWKNSKRGVLLNNEGTCLSLWLVDYKENLRGYDQVKFIIRVRVARLLDLAFRNDGPT